MKNPNQHIQDTATQSSKKRFYILAGTGIGIILLFILYFILSGGIPGVFSGKSFHSGPMNVILITLDTVRADYLSCYKTGNAQTPNLDGIAAEGVLFENCISQTPLTLPEHVTILSGTYPLHHRVRDNGGFRVPQQLELISEVMQKKDYETSAFIGAYVLHSKWGINQGFDTYSDSFDLGQYRNAGLEVEKDASVVLKDAQQWIQLHKEKRFFTWIHLFDPHAPYTPPAPYNTKHSDNPYAGEIEYTDAQLGLFFQFLKDQGLYDKTIIVITADHGEGLMEHQERTHGYFVYQPTVWVPFLIRAPYTFPGKRITSLVEHVDLAPTILDMLGVGIPSSYQGQSLLPFMQKKEAIPKEIAYTETFYPRLHLAWSELQALYYKDLKYIRAPKDELYNLPNDKNEMNNISEGQLSMKKDLQGRLIKFVQDKSRKALSPEQLRQKNPEDRARLESLGYITSTPDNSLGESLPDPKDKLPKLLIFEKAKTLMDEKKYQEAIQLCDELLTQEPNSVDTLNLRGTAYLKNNQSEEAANDFNRILKIRPDYNEAMINLVEALMAGGKADQAISEAQRFLELFPGDTTLYAMVGETLFFQKKIDLALEKFLKAVDLEENNSQVLSRIGDIYFIKKDYPKAESYFKKALEVNPKVENANFGMAMLKEAQGEADKAREYYKKELDNNDRNRFAAFNLGELLKKGGAYDQAIPYYKKSIEIDPQFKLPYILIARYYLESGQNLEEGIQLCKTAISIKPANEVTLMGYFILTNIYAKLDDMKSMEFYSREGEKLYQFLEKQKEGR